MVIGECALQSVVLPAWYQLIAGQLQLVLPELTVPLTEAMAGLGSSTIILQALLLFSKPGEHDLFRQLEM